MDFIVGFLKVDGMNTIMVVVEITKYMVFVAALIVCTTKVTTKLFYHNMVKHLQSVF